MNFTPPIAESPILPPDPERDARLRARRQELENQGNRFLELLKDHTWNEAVRILKEEKKKQGGENEKAER